MSILNIHATAHLSPRISSYDSSSLTPTFVSVTNALLCLVHPLQATPLSPVLESGRQSVPIMSAEAYSRLYRAPGEFLCCGDLAQGRELRY
jgi:hypothetical protein